MFTKIEDIQGRPYTFYTRMTPQPYYTETPEGLIIHADLPKNWGVVKSLNKVLQKHGYAERVFLHKYSGNMLWCDAKNSLFYPLTPLYSPYPVKKHRVKKVYKLCDHEYKTLAEAKKHYINLCKLWYIVPQAGLCSNQLLDVCKVYKTLDNH